MQVAVSMALMPAMVLGVARPQEEIAFGRLVQPWMRVVHVQGESEATGQIHERRGRKDVWGARRLEVVIQGRVGACLGIHGAMRHH